MLSLLPTLALVVFIATPMAVEGSQLPVMSEREGLHGRYPIMVTVALDDEARAIFDAKTLRTSIELRLRTVGVDVRETQADKDSLQHSVLALEIDVMKVTNGNQIVYVNRLALKRFGLVLAPVEETTGRGVVPYAMVPVWQRGGFGIVGTSRTAELRQAVEDMASDFLNAYLAANPKK